MPMPRLTYQPSGISEAVRCAICWRLNGLTAAADVSDMNVSWSLLATMRLERFHSEWKRSSSYFASNFIGLTGIASRFQSGPYFSRAEPPRARTRERGKMLANTRSRGRFREQQRVEAAPARGNFTAARPP